MEEVEGLTRVLKGVRVLLFAAEGVGAEQEMHYVEPEPALWMVEKVLKMMQNWAFLGEGAEELQRAVLHVRTLFPGLSEELAVWGLDSAGGQEGR